MLPAGNLFSCRHLISLSVRSYSLCGPPRKQQGKCGVAARTVPPGTCAACRPGPIPYNPCVPIFHHGKDTWKKQMYITLFVCFPLIIIQAFNAFSHETPEKTECREYEYMRIRSKRFPWGDGVKTFFHNDHVNFLPGECVIPRDPCA